MTDFGMYDQNLLKSRSHFGARNLESALQRGDQRTYGRELIITRNIEWNAALTSLSMSSRAPKL